MTDKTDENGETVPKVSIKNLYEYVQEEWLDKSDFKNPIQESIRKNEVIARLTEMSSICKDGKSPPEPFDWDSIYGVCTNIMEDYSEKVDAIFMEIDQLNRQLAQWQESSFAVDAHRATKILNENEEWIKLKEEFLNYKQKQLGTSANEIRESVGRLTKTHK